MPDKQTVINSLEDRNYTFSEVRHLVDSVKTVNAYSNGVDFFKVGDIFTGKGGFKSRPFVIIKIMKKEGLVVASPLTTTKDELALTPFTSRFLSSGWFTNQLITVKLEHVENNFAGTLDNNAAIKQFKKDLKQFYKGLL